MRWRSGRCRIRNRIASSSCGATSNAGRRAPRHVDSRLLDWKAKSQSFDLFSAWSGSGFIMYGNGAPERLSVRSSPANIFGARRRADLGRALTSAMMPATRRSSR
jgi:hypothetical protein